MTDCDYPRRYRITEKKDFDRVFSARSGSVRVRALVAIWAPNSLQHPRLGMAASRKNLRTAVRRNRLRRILRETFRLHRTRLPAIDIVIMVRREIGEVANDAWTPLSRDLFQRIIHRHQADGRKPDNHQCAGS